MREVVEPVRKATRLAAIIQEAPGVELTPTVVDEPVRPPRTLQVIKSGRERGSTSPRPAKPTRQVIPAVLRTRQTGAFCERSAIAERVMRRASGFRACFERRLQVRGELSGKVTARWVIGPEGRVQEARVEATTLGDAQVERCVVREISRIRFPEPRGGVCAVRWPFVFSASR